MIICGIDPGLSGGVAIISQRKILRGFRMPVMVDPMSRKKKKVVNINKLAAELAAVDIDMTVVERVHAMPGQGVTSMFSFGVAYGQALAVATLKPDRSGGVVQITPQAWKGYFGLKGSDKGASIAKAQEVFGDSYKWKYLADNGIAEAALMAQCYLDKNEQM